MKKCIVISPQVIIPPTDGGKNSMYNHLISLAKISNISLVMGNNDDNNVNKYLNDYLNNIKKIFVFERVNKKIKKINYLKKCLEIIKWFFSFKPRQAQTIESKKNKNIVTKYIIENNIDHIILETPFAFEYLDYNILINKDIEIILIQHNVEYLFRKDCLDKYGIFSWWEVYLTKQYEKNVLKKSNRVVTISPKDKEILKNVFSINNIEYLPTPFKENKNKWIGNDSNYILFSGSLEFYPNYHGIKWFIKEIFYEFIKEYPNIKLKITGKVNKKIKKELSTYNNIEFTGFVSDKDLEELLLNCNYMVIPIIKGSGIKIKLLEALSMGIPTIVTEHCYEGMPFDKLKYDDPYLVAKNEKDFISKMRLIINNNDEKLKISNNAKLFFEDIYGKNNNWANKLLGEC
ncbi:MULTISPECIES: glycosyltransferase [Megamonas]|uniref:Glycosyltransferase family 1 protein n=1 Tax=Megamonas rupellensis TaxID=491921 RepID=A0A412CBZ7_9FIRM|nr:MULTISPECIES: glycosyltransferase [Megamonas]MCX4131386.1 glycosyltransferase [Megamonas funiformis]RGQ78364.1 glycosyltransferase family 1 protein [Megamonas rupellensis]RHG05222.1 glycosyltransferase family 1 protein [Megamonas funiformis]